jgi:hypothetical protein
MDIKCSKNQLINLEWYTAILQNKAVSNLLLGLIAEQCQNVRVTLNMSLILLIIQVDMSLALSQGKIKIKVISFILLL